MLAALIGVAVAVLTIVFARFVRGERWVYSLGLVTLPSLYASFALRAGEPPVAVSEITWGIPYLVAGLVFTFVGFRQSAVVVGALWILHGLYDLVHSRLVTNAGVPAGYPVFCFVVDVIVGAYVLWLSRRIPDADLHRA